MKIIIALLTTLSTAAFASSTQKQVVLENELRNRIYTIIEKVDPAAIVQVEIKLKKVSSEMPTFGFNAEVTPVEYDGELGASSMSSISVRVLTQLDTVPEWIQNEIKKTAAIDDVKLEVNYEKASGSISNWKTDLSKVAKEVMQSGGETVKYSFWGLIAAVALGFPLLFYAVMSLSRRLEVSLARVIEEKVVPALAQTGRSAGREFSESAADTGSRANAAPIASPAAPGSKELSDVPDKALQSIMCDCYWAESDGYAHYLWTQMSQSQRQTMLAANIVDPNYYSYFRQAEPTNLNYHLDARYLNSANDFATLNQKELADWLRKNPKSCWRITPLRWDLLPLSLAERLEFNEMRTKPAGLAAAELNLPNAKSPTRVLPVRIEIKSLKAEDEEYIWNNPGKVPVAARPSLRSLVWLAMAPDDYRQSILADLDARQLAEAWSGPEAALNKLRSALPARKAETLDHLVKTTPADRNSPTFAYLFDAGLRAPTEAKVDAAAMRKSA